MGNLGKTINVHGKMPEKKKIFKNDNKNLMDNPANIYLLKVNNRNTRKRYEICLKLTIKAPERRQ